MLSISSVRDLRNNISVWVFTLGNLTWAKMNWLEIEHLSCIKNEWGHLDEKFKRTLSPFCLMFSLCLFCVVPSNYTWGVCMCQNWERIKDVCKYATNSDWLLHYCNCQQVTVCWCVFAAVTFGFILGHKPQLCFWAPEERSNHASESICPLSNVLTRMWGKCGTFSLSVFPCKVKWPLNHRVNRGLTEAELHLRQLGC